MSVIEIDASRWTEVRDFYDAVLPAIGAPEWHGRNLNALIDSILGGGINSVEPPYVIVISGTASADKAVVEHVETAKIYLAKAGAETHADWDRDVNVTIEIEH